MFQINQNLVAIFLVVLFLWWVLKPSDETEGFDSKTVEFVPVGCDRYGLRGDELRRSDIDSLYIKPNPEVRLNQAGGEMWRSDNSPEAQGDANCKSIPCPDHANGQFKDANNCWQCGSGKPEPWDIPDMHSHA